MTHDQMLDEVIDRCRARGLLYHNCINGRQCRATPGLPDLIVAGIWGAAFLEIKTQRAGLSADQGLWYHTLTAAGQIVTVVREEHLTGGQLDALLDRLADHG